jgi:hypothetical protein
MDDRDVIPRDEAIGGLALLGALTLALVGTIVLRIVQTDASRATKPTETAWASSSDIASIEPTTHESQRDASLTPATAGISTVDEQDALAPDSSDAATAPITPAPTLENPQPPPIDVRPRFIAPSGRQH